jgi:DNA primase
MKVVTVPFGKDPADCIKENVDLWKQAVRSAVPVVDFYIRHVGEEQRKKGGTERSHQLAVRDQVLPIVNMLPSNIEQSYYDRVIGNLLGVPEESVRQDREILAKKAHLDSHVEPTSPVHSSSTHTSVQQPSQPYNRIRELERMLAGFLFWQETNENRVITEEHIQEAARHFALELTPIVSQALGERETLSFQAEIAYAEERDMIALFRSLVRDVVREQVRTDRARVAQALRRAEYDRDEEQTQTLLIEFQTVSKRLEVLDRNE